MNFICRKNELLKAINIVSKAASKIQKTILECILFECREGKITLKATDIALSIKTELDAEIMEEGEACIPARYLYEIINKFSDSEITFNMKEDTKVEISCANSKIVLSAMDSMEFPSFPVIEKEHSIKIRENVFKAMLMQTVFATAQSEDRPILTGVMINVNNSSMEVVAVDGFRMAIRKEDVISDIEQQMIIPGRTIRELIKITGDTEESIKIMTTGNMALFEIGKTKIYSRLIEGEYIKYRNLIPENSNLDIIVEKEMLKSSVERASVLAREGENYLVKLSVGGDVLKITSESQIGNIKEEIPVIQKGDDILIGLNAKYLLDILKVIDDNEIKMFFGTSISPCLIKGNNVSGFEYLILPVKL